MVHKVEALVNNEYTLECSYDLNCTHRLKVPFPHRLKVPFPLRLEKPS